MAEKKRSGVTMKEVTPEYPGLPTAPPNTPNVVLVVFDDTGFADFGCYGSEIRTPNIDRLAAGGLRFTNFHTTSLCSPTRASLLTGRNHHAVGMGSLANYDYGFPGYRGRVEKEAAMLPEVLRPFGFNSFALGKWHLTPMHHIGPTGPFDLWPTQRGFDRYYGFMDGAMNQWDPFLTEDNHHVAKPDRKGYHLTDDLAEHASDWISAQKSMDPDKPFFMYLAFGAGHSPHHVTKERIAEYIPVFEKGWDKTREDRIARQKAMGIIPQDTVLPPRNPGVSAWDDLTDDEKYIHVRFQAAFAAMITHTDEAIGHVMNTLERIGQFDNTIFIVMSDNGASQEGGPAGTMNQGRYFERVDMSIGETKSIIDEIGETQWFNNYPLGWAMAGNTPCKFYKQNTHGGGVRDPFVMHWPAGIATQERGTLRHQFHHCSDVAPTLLEMLGTSMPPKINGVEQMPMHGTPMTYAIHNANEPTRKKVQHFEMLGHRGIVADGWKAVTRHKYRTELTDDVWELYDLNNDFSEAHDLASQHPDKLDELIELWWEEAAKYNVLPIEDGLAAPNRRPVRSKFRLWPGLQRVPSDNSPRLTNTSHRISAHFTVPEGGCEGVLIKDGDIWAGYSMFIQNSEACFRYHFPMEPHDIRTKVSLTPGDHELTWEFTKTTRTGGVGELRFDGAVIGKVEIPRMMRGWMPFNGMDVGRDNGAPVSPDYASPFEFTGTIKWIDVDLLSSNPGPDAKIHHDSEMGKQ
jgi:arylsulfatase